LRALIEFQKLDRFIGHLDVLRSFQRAILRSRLPVAYSQGFHPHMLVAFASPLSVGQAGLAEYADVALAEYIDETAFYDTLRKSMPDALSVTRVRMVLDTHPKLMAMLRTASFEIAFDGEFDRVHQAADTLISRNEYIAIRVSKTKTRDIDIRSMIKEMSIQSCRGAHCASAEVGIINARVSFTEAETLKPDLLVKTLCELADIDVPRTIVTRTGLYGDYGSVAVPLIDM